MLGSTRAKEVGSADSVSGVADEEAPVVDSGGAADGVRFLANSS